MGQARQRGTFEERKLRAIVLNEAERLRRETERRGRYERMPMKERLELAHFAMLMVGMESYAGKWGRF